MGSRFHQLAIDSAEQAQLAEFWAEVLGYIVVSGPADTEVEIARSVGSEPSLIFVPVPETKTLKNRLHIDVRPTGTDQQTEFDRLLGVRPKSELRHPSNGQVRT